jgi:hypothetical protein
VRKRRYTLLLSLALVALLAAGTGVALLWPTPSEAERMAERIEVGMTFRQVAKVVPPPPQGRWSANFLGDPFEIGWDQDDGSTLFIEFATPEEGELMNGKFARVAAVRTTPPPPVHPLTRLRRTLARAFPFLGE